MSASDEDTRLEPKWELMELFDNMSLPSITKTPTQFEFKKMLHIIPHTPTHCAVHPHCTK